MSASNDPNMQGGGVADGAQVEQVSSAQRFKRALAYGLGATKWQVVSRIVLPSAFGRIATGIVLGIGRAIGETAVVLYTMGQAINMPTRWLSRKSK